MYPTINDEIQQLQNEVTIVKSLIRGVYMRVEELDRLLSNLYVELEPKD